MLVHIVKSFHPDNGYVVLRAFYDMTDAEKYQVQVEKQITEDDGEFIEIETLTME